MVVPASGSPLPHSVDSQMSPFGEQVGSSGDIKQNKGVKPI